MMNHRGGSSERGAKPSTNTGENEPTDITLDMGNTVNVMVSDHEIESSQKGGQPYSKKMVYLVIALAVLAVIGIITLISVSVGYSKAGNDTNSLSQGTTGGSLPIADDSGNNNGGATSTTGGLSPPYDASVTSTVIPSPSSASTSAPTYPEPAASDSLPAEMEATSTHAAYKEGCLTDRFDNEHNKENNRLYPGQFICSTDDERRFQFGLAPSGNLVYKDTQENSTVLVFDNPYQKGKSQKPLSDEHPLDYYFSLQTDGTFVMNMINNTGTVSVTHTLWTAEPKFDISLTEKCLPHHDCPYLHVHQGGIMVLNWIGVGTNPTLEVGSNDNWQNHNFLKVYNFDKNK